jgi:hypothetical protein
MAVTEVHDAIEEWRRVVLPRVDPSGLSVTSAREGLSEVARIQAALDAAQATFVGVLKRETGRDTAAPPERARTRHQASAQPVQPRRSAPVLRRSVVPRWCAASCAISLGSTLSSG